ALARLPAVEQRAICTEHRVLCGNRHLGNRLQRARMLFLAPGAFVVFSLRRIGAHDEQIVARRKSLMASARGQDGDVSRAQLEYSALISAEAHFGMAARDAEHLMRA